jgi:hypothetical protein
MNNSAHTWLSPRGATEEILQELKSQVKGLPSAYIDLLRLGNGGEVGLKVSPLNLCLDSAEAALGFWKSGTYTLRGVFVFGGNGGGEYLAFDMRKAGACPVISFDPIDPEGSIEQVAPDFGHFMTLVVARDA